MSAERFPQAFQATFANPIDRAILVSLHQVGREVRYEELRRLLGSPPPQTFQYALDRLMGRACVARRLQPHGKAHASFYSPTELGLKVARTWSAMAEGQEPEGLRKDEREALRNVLLGHVNDAASPVTA